MECNLYYEEVQVYKMEIICSLCIGTLLFLKNFASHCVQDLHIPNDAIQFCLELIGFPGTFNKVGNQNPFKIFPKV